MDARPDQHPTDQTLSSYGLGKLDDASADAVNKHLEQCPDCRNRVAEMSADSFLERVRDVQKPAGDMTFGQSRRGGMQRNKAANAVAAPPASTLPPDLAEHPDYEIKRELGRGGMGVVYLAHNRLMGRDEVLKVMSRQIMERPGVLERFLREIRAVGKLRHPNIVTAYHAIRLRDSIVFAMEFVEGLDLSRIVKAKGPLLVNHACNFIYQAALGLQHAHEEGLVHRDIKPGNLMLASERSKATIKILDFGLAKVTREQKVDSTLTSEGQALGTPDFIAPEQIIDAQSADIRADIYSLGATLYYLLTGRPPFQANSLYDIYQAHISRDADLLNFVRPQVPSELAALVAKMMAKDPARRFQTPGEVAQALAPFFKRTDAAFKSPKVDVFQSSQSTAGQPVRKSVSTPTQPATESRVAAVSARTVVEPSVPVARWESLIESRETERSQEARSVVAPTRRRPPWIRPALVPASVFGLVMLGVIVVIITTRGRTKNDPDRGKTTSIIETQASGVTDDSPTFVPEKHNRASATKPQVPENQAQAPKTKPQVPENQAQAPETKPQVPENQARAPETKPQVSDAPELKGGKHPPSERAVSLPDPALTGSVWVGIRRFDTPEYEQGCELKITSRAQTQFEGEMTLTSGLSHANSRFAVKVEGAVNGETVKFKGENKENFQQEFKGRLIDQQMSLEFSGVTKNGQPFEGTMDLTLNELNASVSPRSGKSARIVASWFAVDDADRWDTLNEDGTSDATRGLRVECNQIACWLKALDIPNRKLWGWHAPPKYLGDHSEKFGRFLTYRILTDNSNRPPKDVYVKLRGDGKEIFVDGTTLERPVPGKWKTYSFRLDASGGWKLKAPNGHLARATDEDIKQVLSRMTRLWIKGEYGDGPATGCLRYVQFGGSP